MDRDTHVIIGIIRDGTRLELKNVECRERHGTPYFNLE